MDAMLGKILRYLVTVPSEMLGTLADLLEKMISREGSVWFEALKRFLRKENPWESVVEKVAETVIVMLTLAITPSTPIIAGKPTSKCFTNKNRYYYRDSDLDSWLPVDQSPQAQSTFSIKELGAKATFKQVVENFLGVTRDIQFLARTLKERGHTTTLPTIEWLIEQQEKGKDVGLRTDGYANFFFIEDDNGSVSVVGAYRHGWQWRVSVRSLEYYSEWYAGSRFFFRNSDPVSL